MFETTLRRMLALFPRGITKEQIIWRLKASGLRVDASEMLNDLVRLSELGAVAHKPDGRWCLTEFSTAALARYDRGQDSQGSAEPRRPGPLHLIAVDAVCRLTPPAERIEQSNTDGGALPQWSSLLSYYAATQRHDPRGQIEEFPDRHSLTWQLFRTSGTWWSDAALSVASSALPASFGEALAKRNTDAAALGWPVTIFNGVNGISLIPALLVPAEWRFDRDNVVFTVEHPIPALNPAWVREVRRRTTWTESRLQEHLFPEGEDLELAAIAARMKFALATLGAEILQPGHLDSRIASVSEGCTNSAAIFLPEDGSFTRGTAEDLECLRDWDESTRSGTALATLLECRSIPGSDEPAPLSALRDLTPSQIEAAQLALDGPITVIQGPPGTGKSEVILSLLASAVISGRTVLFGAKNHQAVDEIEKRLTGLVPDAPIFVRARDAEGERDSSFLDALAEIAKGKTRSHLQDYDPEETRSALIAGVREAASQQNLAAKMISLNIEASKLAERIDFYDRYDGVQQPRATPKSLRFKIRRLLGRVFGRGAKPEASLPPDAPRREVERRLALIKQKLSVLESSNSDPKGREVADLQRDLTSFLPKLANWVALPDHQQWKVAFDRQKELEFQKVRSARRMNEGDARLVLRHRPIWAISTLSVPSRIPLIPNLFDYVIFDEASQCDIASALPLLARARRAVIVGDPMQLRFVPSLGSATEHALMDAAGLPAAGRASFAQSINSLFDFAESRPTARRAFLADQFRSAPAIVDYLNQDFYSGRLIGRREDDFYKPAIGYKPGLTWEDVAGQTSRKHGGNINELEAARIATLVRKLANDREFTGSVGVISPFNAQVSELQTKISQRISDVESARLRLKVATVDKFQGAETDVLFFSLTIASGAPASAKMFLQKDRRRLNVAVSRARAICVVVGDLGYAKACGIRHIEFLAKRASTPWSPPRPRVFDSEWERRLDTALRARGLEPFPQFAVGTRYLDFALDPEGRKINVEVDGRRWHTDASGNRKVGDILRDREMKARGWTVLRFWVHELANGMEGCVDRIERELGRP